MLQMVVAFEKAGEKRISYQSKPRRAGDIATCCADPAKAAIELGWRAELTLEQMMQENR